MEMATAGHELRALRERKRVSRPDAVAGAGIGLSPDHLGRIERGEVDSSNPETLVQLRRLRAYYETLPDFELSVALAPSDADRDASPDLMRVLAIHTALLRKIDADVSGLLKHPALSQDELSAAERLDDLEDLLGGGDEPSLSQPSAAQSTPSAKKQQRE